MATAGSGDVLAGVVAALVSQGLSTFDASWLGVFWHGLAGELARRARGSHGVIAGDLCDSLPKARHAIEGR
jgi:NAD(P)H-hydrate epimerase